MQYNIFTSILDDMNYLLDMIGEDVQVNCSPVRCIITNTTIDKTNFLDDKYISTIQPIKTGDIVDYSGRKWLIMSQVNGLRVNKYKALIRCCNYSIKFNFQGTIKEFPAIVSSKTFDITTDKFLTLPTGKILVTLQENDDTLKIQLEQRFIKLGSAWKVSGIDRTQKGLITLSCDIDLFSDNDDLENEIADYWKFVDRYTVAITDSEPININKGNTYQLHVQTQKNGSNFAFPLVFASDNTNICTVDENGLITAISNGIATITVSKADDASVYDTISVNVNDISITINGNSTVDTYADEIYTCTVKQNGQVVNGAIGKWSIDYNGNTTSIASISPTEGASVTLSTSGAEGTIYLVCAWKDNPTVTTRKAITIESQGGLWG